MTARKPGDDMSHTTWNGESADTLNERDAWFASNFIGISRTCVYSDATGVLRRLRLVVDAKTMKPQHIVAEVLDSQGKNWMEYGRPSFAFAEKNGLIIK